MQNSFMSHIKEQAVNLEIMAGIIASLGMIVIMTNELAGKLLMIGAMSTLCILYIILCFTGIHQDLCKKRIVFLNYLANTMALVGMILSIVKSITAPYVLIAGMILLFVIFILNLNETRNHKENESWFRIGQIRILVVTGLSILFFMMG